MIIFLNITIVTMVISCLSKILSEKMMRLIENRRF